jgi:ABC-type Fe3+-hydroxamate transport system substrate-binding protein
VTTTRTLVDDLGTEVVVPTAPQRLVSLVPNLTETLWWWRLADRVVGRTEWCTAPPHAFPDAATVRGTKNPDVAAIVDLAPDLVIANEEEQRELDVTRLRDAGVAVWVTRVRTLEDVATSLDRLATAVGVPGAARDTEDAIARVQASRPATPTVRAFVPIWRGLPPLDGREDETWMAVGADTVAADVLAAAGIEVWPGTPGERYPSVGRDEVRAADLDVALLTDEPYAFGDADRADLAEVRTRAVDGTGLFWWGPRTPSTVADLRRLVRHLHRRRVVPAGEHQRAPSGPRTR